VTGTGGDSQGRRVRSSVENVDNGNDVREFLVSRRAKISPEQAGLQPYGLRRVPGLRRSEVAQLAGVSVEYYTRLERGNLGGVSDAVLDALGAALQLDEAERAHLIDLARAANASKTPRRERRLATRPLRPSIQQILDGMSQFPAFIRNGRLDIIAINTLGEALYTQAFANPARPVNLARFVFLDPRARLLHPNWDASAATTVAILRTEAGRNPYDKGLTDLVGELSTRSEEFRSRWAAHDVRLHYTGTKHFRHPAVGDLDLTFDALEIPSDPGLTLTIYSAQPGTAAADGLSLLASWAASSQDADERAANAAEPPGSISKG
jgi:transcriptional regulator with XRE-family HTH domain